MKKTKVTSLLATLALALGLAACGSGAAASLSIEPLDEAVGVRVVAENAGADQMAISSGALTLQGGDVILVSPDLQKGSFNLTITSQDGATTAYDDKAEGRVLFTCEANPGTYDVQVSGDGATGTMVVCAQSAEELAAQDASLEEALEEANEQAQEVQQ